jgi:hypothetical protein
MKDVAFFFCYVDADYLLAEHLVAQIREQYPESRIVAVSDGAAPENILNCTTLHGKHLKKIGTIGFFSQRNFQFVLDALGTDIESVIKVDPDTFLNPRKRLTSIPADDWAGQANNGRFSWGDCTWAKGGVYCIKKDIIRTIVGSRLLLKENMQFPEAHEISQNRIYEDCRLGYVANELGIYPVRWPEVSAGIVGYKSKMARRFSILHPAKDKIDADHQG